MPRHDIHCRFFSQEDLLAAGCLDIRMAMDAAESAIRAFDEGDVLFPDKIVQIFNDETQERINCLPATFKGKGICGMKWVSVFPPNPVKHGIQNLSAVIILSEIGHGFPIAFMEGTLCSNVRVGSIGALAARYLARQDSTSIGFIGAGEQAKMHLIAMKAAIPSLTTCGVAAKLGAEEEQFTKEMSAIIPDMDFSVANSDLERAVNGADIIVTATSAQALSRMYKDGLLTDNDLHANLVELVRGTKPGRENDDERIYFNAVGLAYVDVGIAIAMYERALEAGMGQDLQLQREMIFEHADLKDWVRL